MSYEKIKGWHDRTCDPAKAILTLASRRDDRDTVFWFFATVDAGCDGTDGSSLYDIGWMFVDFFARIRAIAA